MEKDQISYEVYLKEREFYNKLEQTSYANYEKTLLTVSIALLAFSTSLLSLFDKAFSSLSHTNFLVTSWILFATSIVLIFVSFIISAMGYRKEITDLERRLGGNPNTGEKNKWGCWVWIIYSLAGLGFMLGVACLIFFCAQNINTVKKGGECNEKEIKLNKERTAVEEGKIKAQEKIRTK